MNWKQSLKCSGMLICALTLIGCSTRIAGFTMLSDRNLDLEHVNYKIDKTHRVSGTDTAFVFVIIPFGLPDATTAVKEATSPIPKCVGLANAGVKCNYFWLALGYVQMEAVGYPIIIEGTQGRK